LLREETLAENLEETVFDAINDGSLGAVLELVEGLLGDQGPQLLDVDGVAVISVSTQMETSHTDLTEVAGMVLVEVDPMVMLTSGLTASTRMLSVLANTTVTVRDVTSMFSGVLVTER